jgi:hypothetical protein
MKEIKNRVDRKKKPKKYRIKTLISMDFSFFIGGVKTQFKIQDCLDHRNSIMYDFEGVKLELSQLPVGLLLESNWTTFTSSRDIDDFYGLVLFSGINLTLGYGNNDMNMIFISGPAKGQVIDALFDDFKDRRSGNHYFQKIRKSKGYGLSIGANAGIGKMKINRLSYKLWLARKKYLKENMDFIDRMLNMRPSPSFREYIEKSPIKTETIPLDFPKWLDDVK